MTAAFPLLGLPENAKRKVLNGFDIVQLINFSLLSNKAKQLAKSLSLTIYDIGLYADEDSIEIYTNVDNVQWVEWTFYPPEPSTDIQPVRGTVPIYVPSRVKVDNDLEEIMEYQNPGLSISEWLELFREVFNHSPVLDISWTKPDCLFDMKSLKDTLKEFSVGEHTFTEECSIECAQLALKNMPEPKTVLFKGPDFGNPVEYQDMLIQNVNRLEMINRYKMINRYLKHWVRGSNPRMEHMRIEFEPNRIFDKDEILKSLKYRRAQPIQSILRMMALGVFTAEGFVNIRRKDGTEGTIAFINRNGNSFIVFFVSNCYDFL